MNPKTKKIALGGILLALSAVFLYLASVLPVVETTLLLVAGFLVPIMIEETGLKGGILLYVSTVLFGFLLVPNKWVVVVYGAFLGFYGIAKFLLEKPKNFWVQRALKLLYFLLIFTISYVFFKPFLFDPLELPMESMWIFLGGGLVFFILYDLVFSRGIAFYRKKIKREKEFYLSK